MPLDPADIAGVAGFTAKSGGGIALCYPGDEAPPLFPGPEASRNRMYFEGKMGGHTVPIVTTFSSTCKRLCASV